MSIKRRAWSLFAGLFLLALALFVWPSRGQQTSSFEKREEAYRANNLGVALLEQFKYKEGAEAFRRALQIEPGLTLARINLGIALYNVPELDQAQRELKLAGEQAPDAPQPHYVMGLIAKSQNRAEDAISAFQRVLKIDPRDTGTNINLGQLYAQQRKYPEAIKAFQTALAVESYNATATYNLATALLRSGQREQGQAQMQRFQKLRDGGYGSSIGQNYLEQGRYAEAVASTGAEPELVDEATPAVTFADASAAFAGAAAAKGAVPRVDAFFNSTIKTDELKAPGFAANLSGVVTLFDYDGDSQLDLLAAHGNTLKLYHNERGKLVDVTERSALANLPAGGAFVSAVAGDYDNDEKPDLFLMGYPAGGVLYHNDGNGKFSDRTKDAEIPAYRALSLSTAFVDADHDGDLDLFIAGFVDPAKPVAAAAERGTLRLPQDLSAAPNMLLRNNGNGKFTDITEAAQVGAGGSVVAVVPSDYDNRRDVDLLLARRAAPPMLYSNLRDGTFRDAVGDVGLETSGAVSALAAGDVNKDGYTDFFFGRADAAGSWALSDAQGRYKMSAAHQATAGADAAQLIDYDNDGLLDLIVLANGQPRLVRNLGREWADVSARAFGDVKTAGEGAAPVRGFASGDLDGDGDADLAWLASSGALTVLRNDGGNKQRSLRVQVAGKVSNRSGVGAKIEARAGSLRQRAETYAASPAPAPADVQFGIGRRAAVDAVRVLWPAGIVQAETEIVPLANANQVAAAAAPSLNVIEVDRKPSSCPFLYTWNGEKFEFVTDFMGGGEMGAWMGPRRWNYPDPDEYVRVREDQLRERDGRYELRVTNELEEVLYVDRLQLIAVAHPADSEVYPNEGLTSRPKPFKLHTARSARPPLAATDQNNRDVLPSLIALDRKFVEGFELHRIRGYAAEHTLTLKLDHSRAKDERTVLFLTGWTDYAFSSDNVAAHQAGLALKPPSLQVKDKQGNWRTVIDEIGIAVGRPQTVALDLTGKFLSESREVRIVTNMRVYWDQILFDTSDRVENLQISKLEPVVADLRWRGFSAAVTPDGREPLSYNYEQVSFASPWKTITGRYTREGDVRELLGATDDMFVVSRPGDELTLSFDATRLPALPRNWKRTFLFYADGFSKEMDINSASPDQVLPLPFHGMKSYPYQAPEQYPLTDARKDYLRRYNTRVVGVSVPALEAARINQSQLEQQAKGLK